MGGLAERGRSTVSEEVTSRLIVIVFQGRNIDADEMLDRSIFELLHHQLEKEMEDVAGPVEIDLWLDSPGGDAHASYKIALDLRARCEKFRVIIPDYAKSAATLLALGADEIFMTAWSELGPLDVQIEHPDRLREGTMVSGLDVAHSLTFLGMTAVDLILSGGGYVRRATQLSRAEVLPDTMQFFAQFFEPIVAKLDPHLLHRASQQLMVAERYAISMLRSRKVDEEFRLSDAKSRALVNKLITGYPAHGYIIDRDEARELGLPIRKFEEYDLAEFAQDLHDRFADEGREQVCVINFDAIQKAVSEGQDGKSPDDGEGSADNDDGQSDRSPRGIEGAEAGETDARSNGASSGAVRRTRRRSPVSDSEADG